MWKKGDAPKSKARLHEVDSNAWPDKVVVLLQPVIFAAASYFMNSHLRELRSMCFGDLRGITPFRLRTRFERHLFGAAVSYAKCAFEIAPKGLSRRHYEEFAKRVENLRSSNSSITISHLSVLSRMSALFEKFTSLCDTSNWSDDGQDPRIEWCKKDILSLCDELSAATSIFAH
jgi:hypothetical protein